MAREEESNSEPAWEGSDDDGSLCCGDVAAWVWPGSVECAVLPVMLSSTAKKVPALIGGGGADLRRCRGSESGCGLEGDTRARTWSSKSCTVAAADVTIPNTIFAGLDKEVGEKGEEKKEREERENQPMRQSGRRRGRRVWGFWVEKKKKKKQKKKQPKTERGKQRQLPP